MASSTGNNEPLIPQHGGYRKLGSYQYAQVIYDVTVRFCDKYIGKRSRTHDQMVQAARSGKQNIAEGSMASGTSKGMELTLTNVARASLEELRLDYEDFLRQKELKQYPPQHPALVRFKKKRCKTLLAVRLWVSDEVTLLRRDEQGPTWTNKSKSKGPGNIVASELVANAVLSLLNVCCYLLDGQINALAKAFEDEGGFKERMYRVRKNKRDSDRI